MSLFSFFGCVAICVCCGTSGRRPLQVCALFHRSNIGDFSGSRWPLKNRGSYCSVCAQTTPTIAPNYGTGQRLPQYRYTNPLFKKFGGRGARICVANRGLGLPSLIYQKPPTKNRVPHEKTAPLRPRTLCTQAAYTVIGTVFFLPKKPKKFQKNCKKALPFSYKL